MLFNKFHAISIHFQLAAASKAVEHAAKVKCKNKISRCAKKIDPSVMLSAAKTEAAAARKAKREEKLKQKEQQQAQEDDNKEKEKDETKKKTSALGAAAKKAAATALAADRDGKLSLRRSASNAAKGKFFD